MNNLLTCQACGHCRDLAPEEITDWRFCPDCGKPLVTAAQCSLRAHSTAARSSFMLLLVAVAFLAVCLISIQSILRPVSRGTTERSVPNAPTPLDASQNQVTELVAPAEQPIQSAPQKLSPQGAYPAEEVTKVYQPYVFQLRVTWWERGG
jgi:hypothetical protein